MNRSENQFAAEKKANAKKLPRTKLFFAGFGLLVLIIGSKNLFAPAKQATALNPETVPAVLGIQTSQNQLQPNSTASTTPPTALALTNADKPAAAPAQMAPQNYVKINNTPTGYLNVRIQPSLSASVISKVYPGETHAYTATQDGWYLIQLKSQHYGWVDGAYVTDN